ncbi:unnamed protein product [Rhizophagus irregularis]|nr:unnamed protein product [Rhizophagus irregularis]
MKGEGEDEREGPMPCSRRQQEEKKWPPHIVFASSLYEEYELYSPSKKYILTPSELKKLKETYSAIYDLNISQIENISP